MDEFVQTEFFLKLDAQSLKTIFEPEKFNVNQANLLHAYVRLAEKQCEDNGLVIYVKNKKMMPDLHAISCHDCRRVYFGSFEVWTDKEDMEILRHINAELATKLMRKKELLKLNDLLGDFLLSSKFPLQTNEKRKISLK